jgi:hypothetical protein
MYMQNVPGIAKLQGIESGREEIVISLHFQHGRPHLDSVIRELVGHSQTVEHGKFSSYRLQR